MNTLFSRSSIYLVSALLASGLIIWLGSGLQGCDSDSSGWLSSYNPPEVPTVIEANIDTLAAQIGGGTQDVALYNDGASDWTLYTMANRFAATPVDTVKGTVLSLIHISEPTRLKTRSRMPSSA